MTHTRPAAVAGSFYPDRPAALKASVEGCLRRAALVAAAEGDVPLAPKLLVVPHAGYAYSGDVAASAYTRLARLTGRIRRVVLLGPAHRVAVHGLAAPACDAFETPLGLVPIDREARDRVRGLGPLQVSDLPHALEHAIEVQLPFLQTVLGAGWRLLPLVVGDARPDEVDAVLEALWGGDETLIIVSTDLSHHLRCEQARVRDQHTVDRIAGLATDLRGDEACGAAPLNGALRAARRHGLHAQVLELRNSADTAGGPGDRVVGYGAIAFSTQAPLPAAETATAAAADLPPADAALGSALLAAARDAVAEALGLLAPPVPAHPRLQDIGATFVTLHDQAGHLRGCVGQLDATRPLIDDVRHNALAAAFGDSRFAPLDRSEWRGLHLEVSLLGPMQRLPPAATLDAAAAQLLPAVDGVVLAWHGRRSTLLPQVWQQLPDARRFLQALLRKAGLSADFWSPEVELWRYRVTAFEEAAHEGSH